MLIIDFFFLIMLMTLFLYNFDIHAGNLFAYVHVSNLSNGMPCRPMPSSALCCDALDTNGHCSSTSCRGARGAAPPTPS